MVGDAFGWISFVLWSLSFYPQAIQNYQTKSVAGFSAEFAMLNPVGFYMYILYNLQGVVSPSVGKTGRIDTNDIFFSVHAFMLSILQLSQTFMYDRGVQSKPNYIVIAFLVILGLIMVATLLRELGNPAMDQ